MAELLRITSDVEKVVTGKSVVPEVVRSVKDVDNVAVEVCMMVTVVVIEDIRVDESVVDAVVLVSDVVDVHRFVPA